jgi:DNA-directed RNA polymerase specialized sigma24 family protein
MAKNNELDKYIKKAKKDDKSAYRMNINYLWDEIYNLAGFLCDEDEQEKVTKRLFIVGYRHIKEYDENECDIHLWMAREATKELYRLVSESGEEIFSSEIEQKDYDFASIDEDDELGEASAEFNEAFLGEDGFDSEEECFASMTAGEKIIYLLYCYESYTIDEIEDIMNIDSSFITSEIAAMREGILAAYAPIKEAAADENEDALGGTDEAEDDDETDDDVDILDDERPVRKPSRPVKQQEKKEYAIGSLEFTEKQFKALILGVFAVLVVIVIIVIVAVVSASHGNNNTTSTTNAVITHATPTQSATTKNAATTEEATEASQEEETTARRVQSGTQPNVEFNTTEAPTQASTEATQPATTKAAETTAATTTQATTTVAPTTTAAPTTAAAPTTTAAEATTAQTATTATTAAPTEPSTASAGAQAGDTGNTSGSSAAP